MRIGKTRSQHLEPAADADDRDPFSLHPRDYSFQPVLAEPLEISHGVLCPGEDDEIRSGQFLRTAHIRKRDPRQSLQCIKIREIRDPRKPDHGDLRKSRMAGAVKKRSGSMFFCQALREAVLIVHVHIHVRDHTRKRDPDPLIEHGKTRF